MNAIFVFLHKHKHLLAVSLMSAFLVLTFQVVMSALTQNQDELPSDLRIENIRAEVISLKESSTPYTQSIPILSQDESEDYNRQGWVARTDLQTDEAQSPILIERLQLSFPDLGIQQGRQSEYTSVLKLPQTPVLKVRICGEYNLTNSCTKYAYNQAGDAIPILFTYLHKPNTNEGVIKATLLGNDGVQKQGIFSLTEEFLIDIEPLF